MFMSVFDALSRVKGEARVVAWNNKGDYSSKLTNLFIYENYNNRIDSITDMQLNLQKSFDTFKYLRSTQKDGIKGVFFFLSDHPYYKSITLSEEPKSVLDILNMPVAVIQNYRISSASCNLIIGTNVIQSLLEGI